MSWNWVDRRNVRKSYGHPPCEDVSWNFFWKGLFLYPFVILLVRMWVEISVLIHYRWRAVSSSLWGCELKCIIASTDGRKRRHPPCEDVSWNEFLPCFEQNVRSSSLWGCELKCISVHTWLIPSSHPPCEDVSWNEDVMEGKKPYLVILFVRMWVEMKINP